MPKSKSFEIKKYSDIILFCIFILVVLLPTEYTSVFSGTIGKLILIGSVVGISYTCNMLSSLLASLIAIILMSGFIEGHEVKYETNNDDDDDKNDDANDNDVHNNDDDEKQEEDNDVAEVETDKSDE